MTAVWSHMTSVFSPFDEDVGSPFSIELCTCVGRAHSRSCPLNPRNKGALLLSSCILPKLNPLLLWVHVAQSTK